MKLLLLSAAVAAASAVHAPSSDVRSTGLGFAAPFHPASALPRPSMALKRSAVGGGRVSQGIGATRPAARSGKASIVPRMADSFIAEDGRTAEEYIKDIFKDYDTQRKGYLTREEYNQWCIDTRRGGRTFQDNYRWTAFVKRCKSDPAKGVEMQGMIDLYNSPEQTQGASYPLIVNGALLASCLIVCIILSIPYYGPDCVKGDLCRATFP